MPAGGGITGRVSERDHRASSIRPELAGGELVKVAWAHNQAEAELVQGLLLEAGVPSLLRRSAGFDVPDMLAAGPRDVMVPADGVSVAREMLAHEGIDWGGARADSRAVVAPARLLAWLLGALAVGALVIWLVWLLVH
jgi:hypothetical protein